MKKTTRKDLSKRLARYGALSVALAGIIDANGQIVYTDVDPDEGGSGVNYALDLNNDSVVDFNIVGGPVQSYPSLYFVGIYGNSSNASILGESSSPYVYPFALDNGNVISSGQTTWFDASASSGTLNFASCYGGTGNSNWCGVTDKYLGLRFDVGGNTYYGWARLDVNLTGKSWTIKDYAYNSVPGEAITAGQTVLGIDDNELNKVKIVALHKTIGLYNLPNKSKYQLFSLTGQSVLSGETGLNTHVIEAKNLATGIYILELEDLSSKAVIRKKVLL